MSEKITIVKLASKQQPSKYKPGETYSIITILDDKNRKLTAMGKWAESWKVGDVSDVLVDERKWKDRDGFDQTGFSLKNPNAQEFGKGFKPRNIMIDAYTIAAALMPVVHKTTKKVTMKEVDELAGYIKGKLETSTQAGSAPVSAPAVPSIDVNKTESAEDSDVEVEEEDDDKPFQQYLNKITMSKVENLYASMSTSMDSIKEDLNDIEEKKKIRGKVYTSIRTEAKTMRDIAQEIRKEILKDFKAQKK